MNQGHPGVRSKIKASLDARETLSQKTPVTTKDAAAHFENYFEPMLNSSVHIGCAVNLQRSRLRFHFLFGLLCTAAADHMCFGDLFSLNYFLLCPLIP